jgi:hypothetical protein
MGLAGRAGARAMDALAIAAETVGVASTAPRCKCKRRSQARAAASVTRLAAVTAMKTRAVATAMKTRAATALELPRTP